MTSQETIKYLYEQLLKAGTTKEGACAVLGNVEAESGFVSNNLQDSYNTALGMSDASYTKAVDNKTYNNFIHDSAGYGLAQWTYYTRKQKLLNYAQSNNKSIGDTEMQVAFLIKELKEDFSSIWAQLKSSNDLHHLTAVLLNQWENPLVKNLTVRYEYAQKHYKNLSTTTTTTTTGMTKSQAKKKLLAVARAEIGYKEGYNNYIKYAKDSWDNQFYGWELQNQPWCDVFVDYCFTHAFTMQQGAAMTYQTVGRGSALCKTSAAYYKNNGAFYDYPEVGDQIFFYYSGDINHTGIVETVTGSGKNWTSLTTIEGNANDQVMRITYNKGNKIIAGFGRPRWSIVTQTTTETTPTSPSSHSTTTHTTIQAGDKVKVKAGAKYYNTSISVPQFVLDDVWIVLSVSNDRVVINKNVSGTNSIMSPVSARDLIIQNTASAPATPEQSTGERLYTVKGGDSFWKIAQEQLGNGLRYGEIVKLNNMKVTSVIHPGDVLKLPEK